MTKGTALSTSWQAAGLTEESQANDVRPYGNIFQAHKLISKNVPLDKGDVSVS